MAYQSVFRTGLFKGQVALVTGGGTGIGRCVAHELASLGATVVVAARRREPLEQTCREITENGGQAHVELVNIRDEESVDTLIRNVVAKFGRLHLLVNNAGGQFLSPAENISVGGFRTVLELNAVGTWTVCRAAMLHWMKEHGGIIVNIVADYFNGFPLMAHTGAARAAVDNMTKTLCQEWGKFGIRINSVAPGTIISSGMQNYPPPVQQMITGGFHTENPSGRLGTEAEVSSAVVWLLSPGAAYVNGACLRVDGGSSLSKAAMIPHPDDIPIKAFLGYSDASCLGERDIPPAFGELLAQYAAKKTTSKL
ncbi:hypothetical protein AMAG_00748 [Allomyces macrogynus ATCC 38327]|uniref:Peroxisomal trans-2-enoyl-CoA reductase n=1 Tax=Allomyces macrogynus (strain ATCC 38327) TaxID=578462 RepID=A0A0L0RXD5_ALLM3|nr:hypothetical protein AMAG_00748 [Allomyces macrogynus ATCC 38327]|eukprot:KNE54794.1 hypothetical protein AMAG_00748 [Allomyces macrogynus ATCC 38327]